MIDKKYLYLGGGGVVIVGGIFYLRHRSVIAAQNAAQGSGVDNSLITNSQPDYSSFPIAALGGGGGTGAPYFNDPTLNTGSGQAIDGGTPLAGQSGATTNASSIYDSLPKIIGIQGQQDLNQSQNTSVTYLASLFGGSSGTVNLTTNGSGSTSVTVDKKLTQSEIDAQRNADYVKSLYTSNLGRNPDAGGLAYWLNKLSGGENIDKLTNEFKVAAVVNNENVTPQSFTQQQVDNSSQLQSIINAAKPPPKKVVN